LANIKEIKRLCGGDLQVAAQANVQIDAEIGQKDHFRMETILAEQLKRGQTSTRGGSGAVLPLRTHIEGISNIDHILERQIFRCLLSH